MKPQRFWAVLAHGELYAHSIYDDRDTARKEAQCPRGYRNCPDCNLRLVRVEVRVVKPKARKARKVRK